MHACTPGTTARQRTREEPLQRQESLQVSFVRRNQTAFRTSNTRTSLYPLPETPIPLHPPSPLPNIPQNSLRTARASAVLLFYTDQMNRVHSSEEASRSFTMAPCVVVERLEGKQRCSRTVSEHAGIQAWEWSRWLFTRNEGSMKNNQPPQAAHHAIMTARRPDNTHSSALVRSQSTKFMARPSREHGVDTSK